MNQRHMAEKCCMKWRECPNVCTSLTESVAKGIFNLQRQKTYLALPISKFAEVFQ